MISIWRRIRRKPLRTVLTLLQVVLGSLAMTLALSLYLDAYARQNSSQAERFDLIAGYRDESGAPNTYLIMDEAGAAELLTLAPDIEKVALYTEEWNPTVTKGDRLYQFQQGAFVDNTYFDLNSVELTRGSFFTQQEADTKEAVALVSDGAAAILFGDEDPLGQSLAFVPHESYNVPADQRVTYKVIGTFAEKTGSGVDAQNQDFVYFPRWTTSYTLGENYTDTDTLNVLAKPGRGEEARAQVLSAARQVFGEQVIELGAEEGEDFYVREMGASDFGPNSDLLDPTVVMFGLFGIVALIVGGVGIFSIMVVDALERERDIGIKRALGATRGSVVREFTLEATLLSGLGGLVGVLIAALVIPLLERQVGSNLFWSVALRWQPVAASIVVGVTLALGLVLGIFPALRAGRTNTVEALKGT